LEAQGGWKTLKALQRYLHIQAEHLARKLKERGNMICWILSTALWWIGVIVVLGGCSFEQSLTTNREEYCSKIVLQVRRMNVENLLFKYFSFH